MIEKAVMERAGKAYGNEPWFILLNSIKNALLEIRSYKIDAMDLLGTVKIQEISSTEARIKQFGFEELKLRLAATTGLVNVSEFDSASLAGRCVLSDDKATLIGCTIVEKRLSALKTPPGWDGSLEMLEIFNKPKF